MGHPLLLPRKDMQSLSKYLHILTTWKFWYLSFLGGQLYILILLFIFKKPSQNMNFIYIVSPEQFICILLSVKNLFPFLYIFRCLNKDSQHIIYKKLKRII